MWVMVVLGLGLGFGGFLIRSARQGAAFLVRSPVAERTRLLATSEEHDLDAQLTAAGLTDRPSEPVELTTADGLRLAARYLPSSNGAAVIAVHGLHGSGASMVGHTAPLIEQGFGVLLIDLRAHGASDGVQLTHGHREMDDLRAALDHLAGRADVDAERIGMLGGSMGGSLAILAAAGNPEIRAVVAECPYARFDASAIQGFLGLDPARSRLVFILAERLIGQRMAAVAAVDRVAQLAPRPLLLLAGGRDGIVPADSARRIHEAAGPSSELWVEPELGHLEFPAKADGYAERITGFFSEHLLRMTDADADNPSR